VANYSKKLSSMMKNLKDKMKIVNIIFIIFMLIICGIKGCQSLPESKIIVTQEYPYIQNGVLYTETKTIPVRFITHVDKIDYSLDWYMIQYDYNKYNGGIITMSSIDFKKIEIQLLGDTYENRLAEARKTATKTQSFFDSFFR
jgi:hypothetical protein